MARGKQYRAVKEKISAEAADRSAAVALLKEHVKGKFDHTVEVHIHLGVDPTKSDQMVRTTVQLPSGSPTQKRIAVFAADAAQQAAAKAAGAAVVGGEELVAKVTKDGSLDADIVVATPAMMPKIAKVARILGPKGLMPNPKTGTVVPDPAAAVKELSAGKVTVKMDQLGNIHEAVGKLSWDADKVVANIDALLEAVKGARPSTMKGPLIKSVTVKSTMSPGVRVSA